MEKTGLRLVGSARCFPSFPGKHLKITRKTRNKDTYSISSRARRWQTAPHHTHKGEGLEMPQRSGRYEGAGRRLHRESSGLFSGRHPCAWNLLSEVPGPVWVISTQPTPGTGALPVKSHSHPSPWPQRRWVEQLQLQSLEHPSYRCRQLCTPNSSRNKQEHKGHQLPACLGGMDLFAASTQTTKKTE